MKVPDELLYTASHEWVRIEDDVATIGITDFAQEQLSDLTFVELPAAGDAVAAADEIAVVESVKAASDVYTPVSGTVLEVNEKLESQPELLNSDPYGEGWLFKIEMNDPNEADGLFSAGTYRESMPADE